MTTGSRGKREHGFVQGIDVSSIYAPLDLVPGAGWYESARSYILSKL